MIETEGISKRYGDFPALQDISFQVGKEHGITALLGPNGAGKTTAMRLITGYLTPNEGKISVGGLEMNEKNRVAIKRRIGYLPETTPLYPEMLISEYLQFIGQVRGLAGEELEERAAEMVELLQLGSHLYSPITVLSRGFRQRVGIAATLIHKPDYLVLDEPTSGLDPNQIQHIRGVIRELGRQYTLILSTHILQEVEDICDRVIIISRGRVVADEPTEVLRSAQACRVVARGQDVVGTLKQLDFVKECRQEQAVGLPEGYHAYACELDSDRPQDLFSYIAQQGIAQKGWEVREFAPVSRSLQEVFQELTA